MGVQGTYHQVSYDAIPRRIRVFGPLLTDEEQSIGRWCVRREGSLRDVKSGQTTSKKVEDCLDEIHDCG